MLTTDNCANKKQIKPHQVELTDVPGIKQ